MSYKGEIFGFPEVILEKMLYYQEQHTGTKDITIFEKDIKSTSQEGGFDWTFTTEGLDFWEEVITYRRFDVFFKTYNSEIIHKPGIIFKSNTAYHAKTLEEAKMLLEEADRQGYTWSGGQRYLKHDSWQNYKNKTCYLIVEGQYSDLEYFIDQSYEVIEVADLFKTNSSTVYNTHRFPFTLSKQDAQIIINAAPVEQKPKLAAAWSSILYNKFVEVNLEFYRKLRQDCTESQSRLYDIIFGKDIDISELEVGTLYTFPISC